MAKPVLVAPLLEPGMLGLWSINTFDEAHKQVVGRQIINQVQYYADKLTALNVEQGLVRFGSGTSAYEMTRDEFLQWATEYALDVGISLGASTDAGVARILVRTSSGNPPLTA